MLFKLGPRSDFQINFKYHFLLTNMQSITLRPNVKEFLELGISGPPERGRYHPRILFHQRDGQTMDGRKQRVVVPWDLIKHREVLVKQMRHDWDRKTVTHINKHYEMNIENMVPTVNRLRRAA